MAKKKVALQDKVVNFYVAADVKDRTMEVLKKEGKTLSEFLRYVMYEKIKEHKKD